MAKKGKNKKNKNKKKRRLKKNYNKKEFIEVFCQTCLICKKPEPTVCFTELCKVDPKAFVNKVFHNLIDIHAIYQAEGRLMASLSVEQFQNVICRTGICFDGDVYASASCDSIEDCYLAFKRQMGIQSGAVIHEDPTDLIEFKNTKSNKSKISYKKKKKKRKKNKRFVCASYPTFFARDNEDFRTAIRKILYGDNDREQNKDQELSAGNSGAADKSAAAGKS